MKFAAICLVILSSLSAHATQNGKNNEIIDVSSCKQTEVNLFLPIFYPGRRALREDMERKISAKCSELNLKAEIVDFKFLGSGKTNDGYLMCTEGSYDVQYICN